MNDRQRRTIATLRRNLTSLHKIRSEKVYTLDFSNRVIYEVEYSSHYVMYTLGPKGGIVRENKVY